MSDRYAINRAIKDAVMDAFGGSVRPAARDDAVFPVWSVVNRHVWPAWEQMSHV